MSAKILITCQVAVLPAARQRHLENSVVHDDLSEHRLSKVELEHYSTVPFDT